MTLTDDDYLILAEMEARDRPADDVPGNADTARLLAELLGELDVGSVYDVDAVDAMFSHMEREVIR